METSRRKFLKILGLSAGVLALDPLSFVPKVNKYAHFDPKLEWGDAYYITDYVNKDNLRIHINLIDKDIVEVIPKAYRHKIHWVVRQPGYSNLGRAMGDNKGFIAWKYSPKYTKQMIVKEW